MVLYYKLPSITNNLLDAVQVSINAISPIFNNATGNVKLDYQTVSYLKLTNSSNKFTSY